ncbi:hypothetical protein [uncultured Treponema sp.]|nr:hypothetical protein [uncultured Treponema sp.]
MKGDAKQLVEFLDGAKNRFIIPVYQRKIMTGMRSSAGSFLMT